MEKEKLLSEWVELKGIEDAAKKRRDEISQELQGLYGIPSDKKSCTIKEEGFSIELKESEKIDVDQVECENLFETFERGQLPFRIKYDLDAKKYNALKEISPSFYERCSQAVMITPGEISVKVVKTNV